MNPGISMNQDPLFMNLALELARKGKGFTSPNPCVGAVVVRDGRVIGQGWHRAAGMPHAEVEALEDAGNDARGATLYVTLEPCNHFGRTPPCTQKILDCGISRVVMGCHDPNPHVAGQGMAFLEKNGVSVSCCKEQEPLAMQLIEDFSWYMLHDHSPFVILKCAATLDGYIATSTGDSQWITSKAARQYGHRLRHEADAIVIGSGTLHSDNPSLTARVANMETRNPMRVVLDTHLTIDEQSKMVSQIVQAPVLVVCGTDVSGGKRESLENKGVQIMEMDTINGKLNLVQVVKNLGRMGVMNLLIEGGSRVAASALEAGIVNKVCYFLAPKLLGGNDGISVFNGKGPEKIHQIQELTQVSMESIGPDFLVQGYLAG